MKWDQVDWDKVDWSQVNLDQMYWEVYWEYTEVGPYGLEPK